MMLQRSTKTALIFVLFILPIKLFAQKDVTKFLGISIDGSKVEMTRKLQEKGYSISTYKKDVLVGEFNGMDVNIHIVTNDNKVWRLMIAEANKTDEVDIKIRFNKLIRQFQSNERYISLPDSTISKYIIPDNEDISYEMTVHKKRYDALFYQKATDYDSLNAKMLNLLQSRPLNDTTEELLSISLAKLMKGSTFKKTVWFTINELYGKYYITMYYDNEYNKANGDSL